MEDGQVPAAFIFIVKQAFLFGAMAKLSFVWNLSDTMNGSMAIPNLIGLLFLTPVVVSERKSILITKIIVDE